MEGITRLVSESLARHGLDRPLDYRRLRWSRWFRCESPHSLLFVPSKPGVFALAEEIMDFGTSKTHVETAASAVPPARSAADPICDHVGTCPDPSRGNPVRPSAARLDLAATTNAPAPRRMLAVAQFFEDDDMAFVLYRMLSRQNPLRARLASGRYFVRFVVIEDASQRRSICNALNQWMLSSAEKASGIGSHFASSLELTPATEYVPQANDSQATLFDNAGDDKNVARAPSPATVGTTALSQPAGGANIVPALPKPAAPQPDSGAATNIHCPSPFPSGF